MQCRSRSLAALGAMENAGGVGARRGGDAGSSLTPRRPEDEPASPSCFPLRPVFQKPMAARRPAGEIEDGERES